MISNPHSAKELYRCNYCGKLITDAMSHYCHNTMYGITTNNPNTVTYRDGETVSQVLICDRCEAIVTTHSAGAITVSLAINTKSKTMTLCPMCLEDLDISFLKVHPAPRGQRAFKEPYNPEAEKESVNDDERLLDGITDRLIKKLMQNPSQMKALVARIEDDE